MWVETQCEALVGFLQAGPALVLTGAGMSTDSGIPDYRGPDGTRKVTPMSHGEFVRSAQSRRRYWARSYAGWARFAAAVPNAGHLGLTRLQQADVVGTVITQNVDGLHQEAGATSVIDLHGRLADVECLDCATRIERHTLQETMSGANPGFVAHIALATGHGSAVSAQIRPDGDVVLSEAAVDGFAIPTCPACGGDSLKPDVVFFGGNVPGERVARCNELTDAAPSLLVIGSSLMVMSGLRFVRRAAQRGIPIAILTRGPTRGDALSDVRIDGPITPVLEDLATRLA